MLKPTDIHHDEEYLNVDAKIQRILHSKERYDIHTSFTPSYSETKINREHEWQHLVPLCF